MIFCAAGSRCLPRAGAGASPAVAAETPVAETQSGAAREGRDRGKAMEEDGGKKGGAGEKSGVAPQPSKGGRTKVRRMSEAEEAPRGTGVRSHRRQDEHDVQGEHDGHDVQDGSLCVSAGKKRPGIVDGRANVRIPGLSKGGDQSYPVSYC